MFSYNSIHVDFHYCFDKFPITKYLYKRNYYILKNDFGVEQRIALAVSSTLNTQQRNNLKISKFFFCFCFCIFNYFGQTAHCAIGDNLAATEVSLVMKIMRIVYTLFKNTISTFSVHNEISPCQEQKRRIQNHHLYKEQSIKLQDVLAKSYMATSFNIFMLKSCKRTRYISCVLQWDMQPLLLLLLLQPVSLCIIMIIICACLNHGFQYF